MVLCQYSLCGPVWLATLFEKLRLESMKYVDVHSHVNFSAYEHDRNEVIQRAKEHEVGIVNVGTQQNTSHEAVEIANQYDHCYAIIGLHPIHTTASYHDHDELGDEGKEFTSRGEIFDTEYYRNLIQSSSKVVGIGECGLDYYRADVESKNLQETAFRAQIELALEYDLPLMLHVRASEGAVDAYQDVLAILNEYKKTHSNLRGQVHFFAGTLDIAQQFLDIGFYISFTGVITFAKMYEELVRFVPMDRILSETDAPYVTPVPFRGQRNEPLHVREVVKKIAEIKGLDEHEVAKQIINNVQQLYKI